MSTSVREQVRERERVWVRARVRSWEQAQWRLWERLRLWARVWELVREET